MASLCVERFPRLASSRADHVSAMPAPGARGFRAGRLARRERASALTRPFRPGPPAGSHGMERAGSPQPATSSWASGPLVRGRSRLHR